MIFVTGGAGFIGANFVLDWLGLPHAEPVLVIDKLTYAGRRENLASVETHKNFNFVQMDIVDTAGVAQLLKTHRPRALVHFAAETHVDRSIAGPDAFVRTNVQGTLSLLEASRVFWNALPQNERDAFRFIQVSTDEVYGSLSEGAEAFTECTPYAPNSPYAASKAGADHLVRAYYQTYGLPTLTTHCGNNYGPMQFPEKLIPRLMQCALSGLPLPVFGDGRQIRDWIYVADHNAALRTVAARGRIGEVYAIGARNPRRNIEVVETLCSLLNELCPKQTPYQQQITLVIDRLGHDRRYEINPKKMEQELGWSPQVSFEEGLRRTVQWYLEHPEWLATAQAAELVVGGLAQEVEQA